MGNNDLYTMSDEAFAEANPEALFKEASNGEPSVVSEPATEVKEVTIEEQEAQLIQDTDPPSKELEVENDAQEEQKDIPEPEDNQEPEVAEEDNDTDEVEEVDSGSEDVLNYEELYEELLSPLKHKGTEFDVKNVDDARRLMSMGLDYAKKTHALKGQRKFLKMLDNNELLDESKLSYAIDLMNGKPEALAQLVKEKGIDTYALSQEEDSKYTPSNHTVGDHEVELEEVIESIRSTATYADTMNAVNNWDESSKRTLAQQPRLLSLMNEHKGNGIYAMVQETIDRERTFGGLSGLSDLEAYQQVGDQLYRQGKFNLDGTEPIKPKQVVVKPKAKDTDKELQAKRKKAAPTKSNVKPQKTEQKYDFWNMSDEDFDSFKL